MDTIVTSYNDDVPEYHSGCTQLSHQGLYCTSRQLRQELFPIFAERHIVDLSHIFILRTSPLLPSSLYQLHNLRHVRLRWPVDTSTRCSCSTYTSNRKPHHYISSGVNVYPDIKRLAESVLIQKTQTQLQSVEFELPLPCTTSLIAFSQYRVLFQAVVEFAETLCITDAPGFVFIQPRWPEKEGESLKLRMWKVSHQDFSHTPDDLLVLIVDCARCRSLALPVEAHFHYSKWLNEDEILAAIAGGRTRILPCPEISPGEKRWKAVFPPGGSWRYWNFAMQGLQRRRQH